MPEGMRAIGTAMHRAASRLAVGARDAEVQGDLAGVLTGLADVMQQCVACHAAYRVH
jgi:cytochrome c556